MSEEVAYMPTIWQQKLISILFLPSCILSIIGSTFILRNIRQEGKNTPYRSIMWWTSICDIIASVGIFFQPFLPPANRPDTYVWAIGNYASCNVLGLITQFAFSAHMYAGLLSYYFLLTVRYGVKQNDFGKKLPYIHMFIFVWSILTGVTGIYLKAYGPTGAATACWVAGDLCEGDGCPNISLIGYSFGGFAFISLLSITVNNFLLYRFVRATVLQGQRRSIIAEQELRNYQRQETEESESFTEFGVRSWRSGFLSKAGSKNKRPSLISLSSKSGSKKSLVAESADSQMSPRPKAKPKSILRNSDKQWKRVREVGKQSLLYVGAYFFCSIWPIGIQVLDNRDYEYNKNAPYIFLPLLIGQSILLPLMGFFNCMIYFRPTFGRIRKKFPCESKIWCVKRTLLGESIKPLAKKTIPTNTASTGKGSFSPPTTSLRVNFAGEIQVSTLGPGHSLEDYSSVIGPSDLSLRMHENTATDNQSENSEKDSCVNAEETTLKSNEEKKEGT